MHGSQSFDWIAFYIFLTNGCSLQKKLVKCLVMMPLLRAIGDTMWIIIDKIRQGNPEINFLWASAFPSPFWYAGEIYGDLYLPYKAVAMVKDIPKWRWAIWVSFAPFAVGKVTQVIFRLYSLATLNDGPFYWIFSSYSDIYLMFTSIFVDFVCCGAMYQRSKGLTASINTSNVLQMIQKSSLLRVAIMTTIKFVVGCYWMTTICIEDYATCPTSYLRWVTITVEYQLYYLDFLLTKNESTGESIKSKGTAQKSTNLKSMD
jgi:hypothetical protein